MKNKIIIGLAIFVILIGFLTYFYYNYELSAGGRTSSIKLPLLIAASNADANTKSVADYVCDGINDQVEIQAAIDSLPAYSLGRGNGGEIKLSKGTFYFGTPVNVRGTTIIKGEGTYSTSIIMTASSGNNAAFALDHTGAKFNVNVPNAAENDHMGFAAFVDSPSSAQGFFTLEDVFIDGLKLYDSGDNSSQIGCYSQMTGVDQFDTGRNTDETGRMYVSISTTTGSNYAATFYSDSARTQQVAFVESYAGTTGALKTLNAYGGSGLGGKVCVAQGATSAADTDITILGNAGGYGIFGAVTAWDSHIRRLMIMYTAQEGIYHQQGWGFVLEDAIVEFGGSYGIRLTNVGSFGKLNNLKIKENALSSLKIEGSANIISNLELSAGDSHDSGFHVQTEAGIYLTGHDNVISNVTCPVLNGNYCIYNITGNRNVISNGQASLYGTGTAYGYLNNGVQNTLLALNSYNLTTGVSIGASNNSISNSFFNGNTTGLSIGGNEVTVNGNLFLNNTGNQLITGVRNTITGNTFVGTTNTTHISYNGDANVIISGNTFSAGATGISMGTNYRGLISNNIFTGQTTATITDTNSATADMTLKGNKGAPNYTTNTFFPIYFNYTIVASTDYGKDFVATTASSEITLPLIIPSTIGQSYKFIRGCKDGGNCQLTLSPQSVDIIRIATSDGVAGKDLINTSSSAKSGDYVVLTASGVNYWNVSDMGGVWNAQP